MAVGRGNFLRGFSMTLSKAMTITATYRIVTPMFCGGADQSIAELRLPSLKGALRFWWRAVMWGEVTDYRELIRREALLFGASDQTAGQSKLRLRLVKKKLADVIKPPAIFERGRLSGAHYLGYGVMEAFRSAKKGTEAGQLTRPMIPGGEFTIECRFSRLADDIHVEEIRRALLMLGTVGGLGSKSRKGFGSLTLTDLCRNNEVLNVPKAATDRLREILPAGLQAGEPEWTAWSKNSVVVNATANPATAAELLDKLGREQIHYRSWGKEGRVLGKESERNFEEDQHLCRHLQIMSTGQPVSISYPRRVVFGLPHNYGPGRNNEVKPENHDRRASPLFLHIDQPDDQSAPVALAAFLPSRFLPENEQIQAFGRTAPIQPKEFWEPIHGYLDRLVGKSNSTKKQTDLHAEEVSLV